MRRNATRPHSRPPGAAALPAALACVVAMAIAIGTAAGVARAQDMQRIAAIVNDDIISYYDLNARVQFAIVSANAQDTPDNRRRFQQQVLKGLIDEKLQRQEASKQNIKVTEQELNRALTDIEKQNGMPPGGLDKFLNSSNVPKSTLTQQVEATISWQKLILRKIKPRIDIGDDEIDETLKRMEASRGQPEFHLAEIFLSIDSPEQEDEVLKNLDRLIEQLGRGARFPALARQFSQSASAAAGGDLGWVQLGQLDEQIEQVIVKMPAATISKPIRTVGGVYLMAVIEKREVGGMSPVRLKLQQALLPVSPRMPPGEVAAMKAELDAAGKKATDCDGFDKSIKQLPRARSVSLPDVAINELPGPLRAMVEPLKAGEAIQAVQADAGTIMSMMICSRTEPEPTPLPSRDDIRERILQQRMDLMARRYLRDLRRAAFVDLRV